MAPIPTSVDPTSAVRGSELTVSITGTGFAPGDVADFGDDVTVNQTAVLGNTSMSASITIAADNVVGEIEQGTFSPSPTVAAVFGVTDESLLILRVGDVLRADDSGELMQITEIIGNELTVTRGFEGTTREALVNGMPLTVVRSPRTVTITPTAGDPGTLEDGFELLESTSSGGLSSPRSVRGWTRSRGRAGRTLIS